MSLDTETTQYLTPAVRVIQNLIEFLEEENCERTKAVCLILFLIQSTTANTFQEFDQKIRKKITDLKGSEPSAEVECVTEIFLRYISLRTAHFNVSPN